MNRYSMVTDTDAPTHIRKTFARESSIFLRLKSVDMFEIRVNAIDRSYYNNDWQKQSRFTVHTRARQLHEM